MTRRSLTSILLGSVSLGALDYVLRGEAVSARASVSPRRSVTSFLARIGVWLHVIFSGMCGRRVSVEPLPLTEDRPLNRSGERRSKHRGALGRCTYALGHILLRRYSYARFVQWLNKFTLLSRIERCFLPRQRFWKARRRYAVCADGWILQSYVSVPLSPD